jgi:hypothetical protein
MRSRRRGRSGVSGAGLTTQVSIFFADVLHRVHTERFASFTLSGLPTLTQSRGATLRDDHRQLLTQQLTAGEAIPQGLIRYA